MEDTKKTSKPKKNVTIKKNEAEIDNAEFSVIRSQMHQIRGQIVMLDFDLAEKYEVETAHLKRQVRRNIERFEGDDFMFELTKNEIDNLSRCQIGTLNKGRGGNIKYLPFAFTELGIAMLSSVLNSEKAIRVNRKIMRAFVAIRQYLLNYAGIKHDFEDFKGEIENEIAGMNVKVDKNDARLNEVFNVLDELIRRKKESEKPRKPIGYKQNNEN